MSGITFLSMFFVILKTTEWRAVLTKSKFNKLLIPYTFLAMLAKCMWCWIYRRPKKASYRCVYVFV